jgi:hypothetical protein
MIKKHQADKMILVLRTRGEVKGEYRYTHRTNDEFVPGKGVVLAAITKTGRDVHVSSYTPSPATIGGLHREILLSALPFIANHTNIVTLAARAVKAAKLLTTYDAMVVSAVARDILEDDVTDMRDFRISPVDTVVYVHEMKNPENPASPSARCDGTMSERAARVSSNAFGVVNAPSISRETVRRLDSYLGRAASDSELSIYAEVMTEIGFITESE